MSKIRSSLSIFIKKCSMNFITIIFFTIFNNIIILFVFEKSNIEHPFSLIFNCINSMQYSDIFSTILYYRILPAIMIDSAGFDNCSSHVRSLISQWRRSGIGGRFPWNENGLYVCDRNPCTVGWNFRRCVVRGVLTLRRCFDGKRKIYFF